MEFTFFHTKDSHSYIEEIRDMAWDSHRFEFFFEGEHFSSLIDHDGKAMGILKNGSRFISSKRTLFDSALNFVFLDEEGKELAVAAPADLIHRRKANIAFPQHGHWFELRQINGIFTNRENAGSFEFFAGDDTWCIIRTGKVIKSKKSIFSSAQSIEGIIQLGNGLPPEFIFPFMLMVNRFEKLS